MEILIFTSRLLVMVVFGLDIASDYYSNNLKDQADDCAPGSSGFNLELGDLIGVKKASTPCTLSNFRGGSINIKNHAGGGATGSASYFLNNGNGLELAGEGAENFTC